MTGHAALPVRPLAEMLIDFESIGAGCEFGIVQRCCGAEPLGLFRFTGSEVDNLVHLLNSGLDDFLSPEDLGIEVRDGEYMVFSRRYRDFYTHTHCLVDKTDEDVLLARERKKSAYLKRRFLSDWQDATRVYVHSGCEDEAKILSLHAALRAKAKCVLLWVVKARSPDERGRVEVRTAGLLKGYLAHHGTFHGGPRVDLPGWAMICRRVDAILRGRPEPGEPIPNPIPATFVWSRAYGGMLEPGPRQGRCRVLHENGECVAVGRVRVEAKLPAKSLAVFSVWVRLASTFEGRNMILAADDALLVNHRWADVRCNIWQQMWAIVKLVEPKEALTFSFYVEARAGSQFHFGGWQIEEGGVPHEGLQPSEFKRFDPSALANSEPDRPHGIKGRLARALSSAAKLLQPRDRAAPSTEGVTSGGLLRTADILLRHGLFDEADGLLRAGKVLFPLQPELFTHYALCAQLRGDHPEAVMRWSDVVDLFPKFALGHYSLAENLLAIREVDRALTIVNTALPRHLDDASMVAAAARINAAALRWAEAVALWDQALAMQGGHPAWLRARHEAANAAGLLSPSAVIVSWNDP